MKTYFQENRLPLSSRLLSSNPVLGEVLLEKFGTREKALRLIM